MIKRKTNICPHCGIGDAKFEAFELHVANYRNTLTGIRCRNCGCVIGVLNTGFEIETLSTLDYINERIEDINGLLEELMTGRQ